MAYDIRCNIRSLGFCTLFGQMYMSPTRCPSYFRARRPRWLPLQAMETMRYESVFPDHHLD